ncbi:MAG TPA: hypothetical protein VHW02_02615 [Rhizomicrobium sp.]|jgi:hypothetical protein|nr:hypothetical protein [Rhizomicrobium sp.]
MTERPLIIVDADEVLLRFAAGFDTFLERHGLYLDLVSYRLHGNVRRRDDNTALLDVEVTALLDEFRTELDWLEAVEGAQDALAALSQIADVVVLSNISENQSADRAKNLKALGLDFRLQPNSGPKGPAVAALARGRKAPVFFVDDIPHHHASVAELAPHVIRIHFIGDERLKALLAPAEHAQLRADNWHEIEAFIRARIGEAA